MIGMFGRRLLAIIFSLLLHALVFAWLGMHSFGDTTVPAPQIREQLVFMDLMPPAPPESPPTPPRSSPQSQPVRSSAQTRPADIGVLATDRKSPATMDAPPAPTAEEWAFAARYTNKNSKGYRYSWGQQVRSMMGTAIEGPDQGVVRFRVEIAPNGTLARLETLWTTSVAAERLARKAIEAMPALPPTPTGQPLIFGKTISFSPFASDGPPSYRDDCLPDPPAFRNPFKWDGQSAQTRDDPPQPHKLDPQALEECMRQLPQDSIEAEMARDQRALERWRWK